VAPDRPTAGGNRRVGFADRDLVKQVVHLVLGVPEWAVRVGLATAQVLEVVDRPSRCRPVGRAAPLRRGAARVGLAVLAVAPPGG
jgi:hypothetical protein